MMKCVSHFAIQLKTLISSSLVNLLWFLRVELIRINDLISSSLVNLLWFLRVELIRINDLISSSLVNLNLNSNAVEYN